MPFTGDVSGLALPRLSLGCTTTCGCSSAALPFPTSTTCRTRSPIVERDDPRRSGHLGAVLLERGEADVLLVRDRHGPTVQSPLPFGPWTPPVDYSTVRRSSACCAGPASSRVSTRTTRSTRRDRRADARRRSRRGGDPGDRCPPGHRHRAARTGPARPCRRPPGRSDDRDRRAGAAGDRSRCPRPHRRLARRRPPHAPRSPARRPGESRSCTGLVGTTIRTIRHATGEGHLGDLQRIAATARDPGPARACCASRPTAAATARCAPRPASPWWCGGRGCRRCRPGDGAVRAPRRPCRHRCRLRFAATGRGRAKRVVRELDRVIDAVDQQVEPARLRVDVSGAPGVSAPGVSRCRPRRAGGRCC